MRKLVMEGASPRDDSSVATSPFSSPNVTALLKIKLLSWTKDTGLPVSVSVLVGNRIFNLHKYPLCVKSGYLKRKLIESPEIELPPEFPGDPETFEMIALFSYGSSTLIDPFNVAALRCAAEFLEMTEDHFTGNLCARFDLYLNQVVLQSWDDTLIVLQKCQALLPLSEELLVVSRCIESLAFMACMEILDPERRRDQPVVTLEALVGLAWTCETVKEIVRQDLWIKDLIALPFGFFGRIVSSLRRQGMKEKYVSPIIVFYAIKWLLSKKTPQFCENSKGLTVLEGVLDLLPVGERAIPVGFYFALLSRSLDVGWNDAETNKKLQDRIASLLHSARVEDFLIATNVGVELGAMVSIFSAYVSSSSNTARKSMNDSIVAELWDTYLSDIARIHDTGPKKFMELIETVPICFRQSHDQLYRALNTFLLAHPEMSQEEKGTVCKYLNCHKLSQEVCIEAVQNELMPIRLIVQALFIQQLNTHQAFNDCSHSFRFSESLPSSRCLNSKSQNLVESPYTDGAEAGSRKLSLLVQKEEYESTSFRIESLEQELVSLKKSIQWHNSSKQDSVKKRSTLGQVSGCAASLNFASQRRYASRLLKMFRRINLFRGRKTKKISRAL